jgi:hypothetical protein
MGIRAAYPGGRAVSRSAAPAPGGRSALRPGLADETKKGAELVDGVAGAAAFLGERVTALMIGGGALILAGVAVSGTSQDTAPDDLDDQANDRKADRTSSTNTSGRSRAAKWPPRSSSFQ